MTSPMSTTYPTLPMICTLRGLDETPVTLLGGKGANLARLVRAGYPVPDGFVITTAAYRAFLVRNEIAPSADATVGMDLEQLRTQIITAQIPQDLSTQILAAYEQLGALAVAVRSSGTAEDLASASFAGQHDTFLDVSGAEALLDAVRACWASLWTPRAVAYRRERGWDTRELALAVVVQRMVPADAAGVAFTANPLTGDRAETIISAVRGFGDRLVSGEGATDEWTVRGDQATSRRVSEGALDTGQALTVARLARRIADEFGSPQDVEWAFSGRELFVLQARPMTALPQPISWRSPTTGGWMRNFRLGEWLPEPVTPLFESWLLARIEAAEVAAEARDFGLRIRPPYHVVVNGWYFSSVQGGGMAPHTVVTALLRHPLRIAAFVLSVLRPELGERWLLIPHINAWRTRLLPEYRQMVAAWQNRCETAPLEELVRLVDEVASVVGEYLWSFSLIGGHAWKVERILAQFYQKHLVACVERSYQELLRGLVSPALQAPSHAVQSLDWVHPTAGDVATPTTMGASASAEAAQAAEARHHRLQAERRAVETACRQALVSRPRVLHRFETLLALAQRYAVVREEQAGWFTFGWPVMRHAVLRLGSELSRRGVIEQVDDIFFLTYTEVTANIARHGSGAAPREHGGDDGWDHLDAVVTARQHEWQRQRCLTPPLLLGHPLGAQLIAEAVEAMRIRTGLHGQIGSGAMGTEQIIGMPASPGRATGPVRIVRGPGDFDQFQIGEVLVAQVTAPAWTPLFERAAAVITDGGSVAAHASLVAREYGIPAVVGTSDATARLHDGQQVIVDGSAGVVEVAP